MKFIVSRDVLYKNLSAISGVLGTSSTLAILDNFLFTIAGNQLTLTASDLDSTMTATVELTNVEGEGSVVVPSKTLLETLKLIPETPIVFEIDLENKTLKFTAANGEYDSSCFPGDEYPQIKEMDEPQNLEIDAQILFRAISKTIFATGNDELRPNMMGVLCELSNEHITFVATDAHKMVRYRKGLQLGGSLSQNEQVIFASWCKSDDSEDLVLAPNGAPLVSVPVTQIPLADRTGKWRTAPGVKSVSAAYLHRRKKNN
jgi:DNA polymerase-3 subunit beta